MKTGRKAVGGFLRRLVGTMAVSRGSADKGQIFRIISRCLVSVVIRAEGERTVFWPVRLLLAEERKITKENES